MSRISIHESRENPSHLSTTVNCCYSSFEEWVDVVLDKIEERWGQEAHPQVKQFEDPLDGLILTMLSQNTNDHNRDVAFEGLKRALPTWTLVAGASPDEVERLIRPAGIAFVKSRRIKKVLVIVRNLFGSYSLKSMRKMSPEEVLSFLMQLPGVGAKTAACVMAFDLGIPAFPVDTHVARFCRRIGWVEEKMKPEDIQHFMERIIPSERYLGAHLNIILQGKNICRSRGPKCVDCSVRELCAFYKK